jgi:hypothetical protein
VIHGLKPPALRTAQSVQKHVLKLRALGECQMQFMRVLLQRIDRKSRPIRKQERAVAENLRRRQVNLDDEDTFDIMQLIQQGAYSQSSKRPSPLPSAKSTPRTTQVIVEEQIIPEVVVAPEPVP